jgi:hypothetical protein
MTSCFPVNLQQEGLWFVHLREGAAGDPYVCTGGLRLTGPLNVQLWRHAWQLVLDKHPALRASFEEVDGELRQVVNAPG